MDDFIVLLLLLLVIPFVLPIVALVFSVQARRDAERLSGDVNRLHSELQRLRTEPRSESASSPAEAPADAPGPQPEMSSELEDVPVPPLPVSTVPPPATAPRPPMQAGPPPRRKPMEEAIGVKLASVAGIAALVVGVVFFVGYAIQNNWITAGLRIAMGLGAGGLLVGAGYVAETRRRDFSVLARVLTGGGVALFYFSVFAAHGIYHLVGPWLSGLGLLVSASAALALSVVYRSQAVALLGVVGAYLSPLLIGGEFNEGVFPLVFMAVVNVPVLLLGLRRSWQGVYNTTFVFTVLYFATWLDANARVSWILSILFLCLYFSQFLLLGLLKLREEPRREGRVLDVIRLALGSLGLLGGLHLILTEAGHGDWVGSALIAGAVVHVALARLARAWRPGYGQEVLTLLMGALSFAAVALPVQLDGPWVSVGWSIEGLVLAWFAPRTRAPILYAAAVALGLFGVGKALLFDPSWLDGERTGFWNAEFGAGLTCSLLLGLQGWWFRRQPPDEEMDATPVWVEAVLAAAVLVGLLTFTFNAFDIYGQAPPTAWILTSLFLLVAGAGVVWTGAPDRDARLIQFGWVLLMCVPVKIVLADAYGAGAYFGDGYAGFRNHFFWAEATFLVLAGGCALWTIRGVEGRRPPASLAPVLVGVHALSVVLLVTQELDRVQTSWSSPAITLWWGLAALALITVGLLRRAPYLRYLGLGLFALSLGKAFLVDLSDLRGLQRIAAFMGLGVFLLMVSFLYQRLVSVFDTGEAETPP